MVLERNIVVLGGSAGSLEPMKMIVRCLPPDFPGSIFVVVHLAPRGKSVLGQLLSQASALPTVTVDRDQSFDRGKIYIAPPDRHLVVAEGHMHLTRSPKEGLHRPSINVTFRTAALAYRERVVGVLLSGMLDDGASGLWEIARNGGVTVVQNLQEASFPSMPMSAVEDAPVNYQLRAAEIGPMLIKLASGSEVDMPKLRESSKHNRFSGFTCPECRGPLYEHAEPPLEFRCRVGHVFPLKTLLDEETSTQERKMYEAIVALEEGADLAEYAAARGVATNGNLTKEAEQLRRHAAAIRRLIEERTTPGLD
jgi:two-component system, chemotaxis family, protein-glutamate methylesterase/glutaminase